MRRLGDRRDERGQISLLIIGFCALLLVGVAVVVNVSAAHLERQQLDSVADGAALHAADRAAGGLYGDGLGGGGEGAGRLGVDVAQARAAVSEYLRSTGALRIHPGLRHEVTVSGDGSVEVSLSSTIELPFAVPGASTRVRVDAEASAAVSLVP